MTKTQKITTSVVALTALLGGCTTTPTPTPNSNSNIGTPTTTVSNTPNTGAPTSQPLQENWQFSGKIGLVYPAANCSNDCRKKSDQGKIVWRQQKDTYTILLKDPFDRMVMRIEGNPTMLVANEHNREPVQTTPNEFVTLVASDIGSTDFSSLSPDWLRYWVTGRPAPNVPVTSQLKNEFVQEGYRVVTQRWNNTSVGNMPSLIIVTKGSFTLRMVVNEWHQPDGSVL